MGKPIRVVKRGRAKDYRRDAKYYDYYYIVVNKKDILLHINGWSEGEPIRRNEFGDFVIIDGKVYYLDYKNI